MVKMRQALVDVVQGIRHNLVVVKQQALVAGYRASIGHNFVLRTASRITMKQQALGMTKLLWSSSPWA